MRFCPTCGAPVELKRPAGDTFERHVCSACGEIHYRNPKVVVGAVCSWQDRVLLCRRAIEPRAGFWAVPAGYLEIGESTEQGAVRETLEEACARIEISGLLAIYNVVRIGQVQLFYRARLLVAGDRGRDRDAGARPVRLGGDPLARARLPERRLRAPAGARAAPSPRSLPAGARPLMRARPDRRPPARSGWRRADAGRRARAATAQPAARAASQASSGARIGVMPL